MKTAKMVDVVLSLTSIRQPMEGVSCSLAFLIVL